MTFVRHACVTLATVIWVRALVASGSTGASVVRDEIPVPIGTTVVVPEQSDPVTLLLQARTAGLLAVTIAAAEGPPLSVSFESLEREEYRGAIEGNARAAVEIIIEANAGEEFLLGVCTGAKRLATLTVDSYDAERAAEILEASRQALVRARVETTDAARSALATASDALLRLPTAWQPPTTLVRLCDLATLARAQGDPARAVRLLESALEIRARGAIAFAAPSCEQLTLTLAECLFDLSDCARALVLYRSLLQGPVASRDPAFRTDLRAAIGSCLFRLDDLDGALAERSAVLVRRELELPPDHPMVQAARLLLADTCSALGEFDRASALLHQVASELGASPLEGNPIHLAYLLSRATLAAQTGDAVTAFSDTERAVAISRRTRAPGDPAFQDVLHNAEIVSTRFGDVERAHALAQELLDVRLQTLPLASPPVREALNLLASVKTQRGDVSGAVALFRQALAAAPEQQAAAGVNDHCLKLNLAVSLTALGAAAEAVQITEDALRGLRAYYGDDHLEVQRARIGLAQAMSRAHRENEAKAILEDVIAWYQRPDHAARSGLDEAHTVLMNVLARLGEMDTALDVARHRLASLERSVPGDHPDLYQIRGCVAELLLRRGDRGQALVLARQVITGLTCDLEHVNRCWSVRAQAEASRRVGPILDLFLSLDAPAGEVLETIAAVRGLAERVAAGKRRMQSLACEDATLRGLLERARQDLATYVGNFEDRGRSGQIAIARQQSERSEEALLERLASRSGWEPWHASRPSAREIARRIPADAAVIVTARYQRLTKGSLPPLADSTVCGLVVTRTDANRVDLPDADAIEVLCARLQRALSMPLGGERLVDEIAKQLSLRLLPLLTLVPRAVTRLYVVPDGELAAIPWDLLVTEYREGRGETCDLVYLDDPRLGVADQPSVTTPSLLVLGDIGTAGGDGSKTGGDRRAATSFAALPAAGREIQTIALAFEHRFPAAPLRVLRGASATREQLLSAAPGVTFLHLASHAYVESEKFWQLAATSSNPDPDPRHEALTIDRSLLAGVVLTPSPANVAEGGAPGILTAAELASLDLSSCELAVLSACDTNVGPRYRGEAVAGLNRALHLAGARHTITSLWRVDDRATCELFACLYENLWVKRLPMARAFAAAQRALAARGFGPHAWAAFVHYASGLEVER